MTDDAYRVRHSVNRRSWHVQVNVIAASHLVSADLRRRIYRSNRIDVRTGYLLPGCYFWGSDVSIGEESWINHGCYFDSRASIRIGAGCDLGMQVMLCTSAHDIGPAHKRAGQFRAEPITVGDGTWIGTRALILPGVAIGQGCIVAAGAIVTRDCEPNGLYAGTPARRIRDITEGDRRGQPPSSSA